MINKTIDAIKNHKTVTAISLITEHLGLLTEPLEKKRTAFHLACEAGAPAELICWLKSTLDKYALFSKVMKKTPTDWSCDNLNQTFSNAIQMDQKDNQQDDQQDDIKILWEICSCPELKDKFKINPEYKDNQKYTLLHHAIKKNNLTWVKRCLWAHARIDVTTSDGETILLLATTANEAIFSEIIKHSPKKNHQSAR